MALGKEEDGGEDGTENIGDGQRNPDPVETVPPDMDEKDRDQDAHGDEENDLPGQAGGDGHPRLVNGLEEIGVDNGETDEREHHHTESQCGFSHFNHLIVSGENSHHRSGEDTGDYAAKQPDGHADPHG